MSNKQKHTAGEWTLTVFKEGDYGVTDGDGGDLIAEGIDKIEDAKLIAAAPKLLEALKVIYDTLPNPISAKQAAQIKAAINKAIE